MSYSRSWLAALVVSAEILAGGLLLASNTAPARSAGPSLTGLGQIDRDVIYVADTSNHRIQKSSDGGQTWTVLGAGKGNQPGQFRRPSGVIANAAGTVVWVADTGNNRIQRSRDGGATWTVLGTVGKAIGRFRGPLGLAYDEVGLNGADTLFVADTLNNRIQCSPNASADVPVWALYVGAGKAVGRVMRPAGLAVSLEAEVWVADCGNNRIQHFDKDNTTGREVPEIFAGARAGRGVGRVMRPTAIHVDEQNRVFVADTGNNRIQVNASGTAGGWAVLMVKGTAVGTVKAPEGVTVGADGTVFVADTGNNRIQRIPAGGTSAQAEVVGASGTAAGQFARPTKIR